MARKGQHMRRVEDERDAYKAVLMQFVFFLPDEQGEESIETQRARQFSTFCYEARRVLVFWEIEKAGDRYVNSKSSRQKLAQAALEQARGE